MKLLIKNFNKIKSNVNYSRRGVYIHPLSRTGSATKIDYGTKINGPAFIVSTAEAPVYIGKYCAIGYNLRIINRNHKTGYLNIQGQFQRKNKFPNINDSIKGPLNIGNNVWIGDNVIILSGIRIGDGAVLGAGSVVTKDVPPFSIVAGNPAKIIKKRFSEEIIQEIIKKKWWNWSQEEIFKNSSVFKTDFQNLNLSEVKKILDLTKN